MGTLRCSDCSLDFPMVAEFYARCPECGEATAPMWNRASMPEPEAEEIRQRCLKRDQGVEQSRANHEAFDRWCEENGRSIPPDELELIPVLDGDPYP